MSTEVKKRVQECLVRSGWDMDLPGEDEVLADLGFDSLGLALWVVEIEREFGLRFPPKQVNFLEFKSLGAVSGIVEKLVKAGFP